MLSSKDLNKKGLRLLKVIHLGRFFNSSFGGIERHVGLLLSSICKSISVVNLVSHEGWRYEVLNKSYPIFKVPRFGMMVGAALCPTMPFHLRKLCKSEQVKIVHLHFPDPMSHLSAYFLPKDVRLVISWHSDIVRQKFIYRFYRPLLNHILRRADAIVAATPFHFSSSRQLPADLFRDRLHVIPYGLDSSFFDNPQSKSDAEKIKAKYGRRPIIFSIGRHVYYKGFEYLIKAMQDIPDATLILGGDGPMRGGLQNFVESIGLTARVHLIGRVPDEDLPAYYHACDVFCLPSIEPSEAFGLVQVEAMFCGKPVVCCELNNGVTWVNHHGETGIVVPPRDSVAMAQALRSLLENPGLRTKLGAAANVWARSQFGLDQMRDKTLALYRQLLSGDADALRSTDRSNTQASALTSISVVSHGHGEILGRLIEDIKNYCDPDRVELILTLNIPEVLPFSLDNLPFSVRVIHNQKPKGFSSNHNAAFNVARGEFFFVLNPDVRFAIDPLPMLLQSFDPDCCRVLAPLVLEKDQAEADSVRKLPTPWQLMLRQFNLLLGRAKIDYDLKQSVIYPDWVAGMAMLFSRQSFLLAGGFDERYFLYYEDVDICCRLRLRGGRIKVLGDVQVVHDARRDSHNNLKFLGWHIKSMLRFWLSPVFIKSWLVRLQTRDRD